MENNYYFSDDELALLSSLRGGSIVYGVNSNFFSRFDYSYQQEILNVFSQLEKKEVLTIDYDGKIRMDEDVYDLIGILCEPSQILSLQINYFNGQKEYHFYYRNEDKVLHMKKGKVYHHLSFVDDIKLIEAKDLDIFEQLSIKEVNDVEEYIDWFDLEGALNYLIPRTNKPELTREILEKKYDEMIIEYYRWLNLNEVEHQKVKVGLMNRIAFEWIEENGVITIQGGTSHYQAIKEAMFMGVTK